MKRIGVGDSGTIGGAGPIIVVVGPPVVGAVIGALVGGSKHRVLGGSIGLGAGIAAVWAYTYVQGQAQVILSTASTLQTGATYQLTRTDGGDPTAAAQAAGFTGIAPLNGTIIGVWSGANGALVPTGLIAKH
jgi:hypothetical protein